MVISPLPLNQEFGFNNANSVKKGERKKQLGREEIVKSFEMGAQPFTVKLLLLLLLSL